VRPVYSPAATGQQSFVPSFPLKVLSHGFTGPPYTFVATLQHASPLLAAHLLVRDTLCDETLFYWQYGVCDGTHPPNDLRVLAPLLQNFP
jgi:hypothetical protein